jgi:hypothetical protein
MREPDRVKVLHGPYRPPRLRKGDRAICLLRDCDVVVTGWTDARIPWPRCRALDGPGRGSGILLDEELARAVRHESAAAVCYWWGISEGVVWRRRKALGVTRTSCEGTRRLTQAAAELGAAELRRKELPPEQVERRRQTALELNPVKGYHGPRWTRAQLRILGRLPDEEVARRTGRSREAVRGKRQALGIPNPASNHWSAAEDALVRTLLPQVAAARTGRSLKAVYERRRVLGLPDGRRAGRRTLGRRKG